MQTRTHADQLIKFGLAAHELSKSTTLITALTAERRREVILLVRFHSIAYFVFRAGESTVSRPVRRAVEGKLNAKRRADAALWPHTVNKLCSVSTVCYHCLHRRASGTGSFCRGERTRRPEEAPGESRSVVFGEEMWVAWIGEKGFGACARTNVATLRSGYRMDERGNKTKAAIEIVVNFSTWRVG